MRKFDKSLNGYNVHQVNSFVDDVVKNVDEMIDKMKQKDREIEHLRKELEHYKDMETTLNRAINLANEAASKLNTSSMVESDAIINDAKRNANRIINDALLKAEQLENDSARMRRNIITFKRRIRNLIDQQADIIDDLDKVDME